MRKDMIIIGITVLLLSVGTLVVFFILSFRSEGVCGLFLVLPCALFIISLAFIIHGMTADETPLGFALRPFPQYPQPPPKQQLIKYCINCNREIPPDALLCPYCGFKSQEKGK
jgi:hypothetical protein